MRLSVRTKVVACAAGLLALAIGAGAPLPGRGADGGDRPIGEVRAQAETASSAQAAKPPAFLEAIGIPAAWRSLTRDVTGTIAIVDTGVDLKHPALEPYLTGGINLLDGRKPPQDDNGHGTAVAGVLAEIAEAAKASSARVSWTKKIMPIKALDRNGEGDEDKLAQGIRYAVDHGADIVVLSLGLRRDTPEMREVAAYAESRGALLVAASGNDAAAFGAKAAVQYPAAYPTVLAVAGANGGSAQNRSTPGPEVDVAAAWKVETLKLGGGTTTMEGTSMSAPQAAGAAALLKASRPEASPAELRNVLKRTAEDIAAKGWDRNTGYGRVRADLAVKAQGDGDWREPNDKRTTASAFPVGTEITAFWSSPEDRDVYAIDMPYDGKFTVSWRIDDPAYAAAKSPAPGLVLSPASASSGKVDPFVRAGSSASWEVARGKYYLTTSKGNWGGQEKSSYRLTSQFRMGPDAMEPNPNALSAFTLAPRSQKWTGTFDRQGDEDWAVVTLPKEGKLRIRVDADTTRIDPAVYLQRAGEAGEETDNNGDGRSEEIVLPGASAGKYYIRIRNAVSPSPDPVVGTYTAQLEYSTPYEDPNEPNDGALTATPMKPAPVWTGEGLIGSASDDDWFRFEFDERKQLRFQLANLPRSAIATVRLYDKKLAVLKSWSSAEGRAAVNGGIDLDPGTYYLAVSADQASLGSPYKLTVREVEVGPLFADVLGHWAEKPIRAVAEAGWMAGYGEFEFGPDRLLTRAEATVIAVRAFKPKSAAARPRFSDVPKGHWAYEAVLRADGAKWLSGIAGTKFEPAGRMTRGEAAILFAKAAGLSLSASPERTFKDVPADSPAASALEALSRKGWIAGFPDGTFRPGAPLTRAEWAAMLAQLL
ncbi:hypothetical protein J19TS2_17640 [Cohnella xylanilytica]|uniref:S8 family serine peptidase n=1 Tax=Cohnella xylanilytica TaxID=557555 RepID=UPI001B0D9A02|nr:S8 family serine peptidase [Cohnella xylanilytica]GIO12209.1 hypothetical protein J19TS2_17640 [Cohnella xylanilytica]